MDDREGEEFTTMTKRHHHRKALLESGSKHNSNNMGRQRGATSSTRWLGSLAVVMAMTCTQSPVTVNAFQSSSGHLKLQTLQQSPSASSTTRSSSRSTNLYQSSAVEEPPILPGLFGHDRTSTSSSSASSSYAVLSMTSSSSLSSSLHHLPHPNMFLKSRHVSLQPMSSLSSDFYNSATSTLTRSPADNDKDLLLNEHYTAQSTTTRSRGVLGFTIQQQDHGDRIVSPSKVPTPMEKSATSLQSSSQQEQSQQQQQQQPRATTTTTITTKVNVATWGAGKPFTHEDWFSSASRSSGPSSLGGSPILNRSPSSSSSGGDAGAMSIPAWFPWLPTMDQIKELKVMELQWVCAERGLKKTGRKAELQQRLWEWTQQQQQRRLVLGNSATNSNTLPSNIGGLFRFEHGTKDFRKSKDNNADTSSSSSDVNSLGEWARTYNIQPLLQRREEIHKEKREGKAVPQSKKQYKNPRKGGPATPTKEYLSKLFAASSSQYSNFEVKEMYAAAKTADQAGDRVLSKQILYKLKEATPHDGRIYRRLSRMEQEEGNVHQAREILQEGIRLHPQNAYFWQGIGQLEVKSGSDREARSCFRKAIELDPGFPNPYHALGTLEHTQGHIAKAMKVLKKGLEYCPTNHRLHHALGNLYREAKMLDMAERSFRKALEHGPEVSRCFAYTSMAHVAYEQDQVDKCRKWLRKAVEMNNGRHAKGWVAWAHFEESEENIDMARSVCMAALNLYERELIKRGRKGKPHKSKTLPSQSPKLSGLFNVDPDVLKSNMLKNVPAYRSGDHFLKVYRNWARLEERHGTPDAVDEIYNRASIAFPLDWKLTLDWARYHSRSGHKERAKLLFNQACEKVSSSHADPYRISAEFEMGEGNYQYAREILYRGAVTMSRSSDGGLGNRGGMAELFHTWAICEWHLNNLSRSEVLFDHALRLTDSGGAGSKLRSMILFSVARLEYARGEYHLAQHCICLCLKENSLPGGTFVLWDLWSRVAVDMGDTALALQCEEQASEARSRDIDSKADGLSMLLAVANPAVSGLSKMKGPDMESIMRKDPWHYKLFDPESDSSPAPFYSSVEVPDFV